MNLQFLNHKCNIISLTISTVLVFQLENFFAIYCIDSVPSPSHFTVFTYAFVGELWLQH